MSFFIQKPHDFAIMSNMNAKSPPLPIVHLAKAAVLM